LDGEPVVRPRLRLTLPDDALDPWVVALELVDEADAGRWCRAADVWSAGPRAVDLARSEAHLAVLADEVRDLVARVTDLPGLESLADEDEPDRAEFDLETAGDFLDTAPYELGQRGIELIGPEHLVRANVRVRGSAREAPADDRKSRFGKEAL